MLSAAGKRGISHGDVIDLNREKFDGFDVREFYVQLVSDLKQKGF
jgi:triacylglycerol lipase